MDSDSYKIFVVEDDDWYRKLLEYNLSLNPDFVVESFSNGKDCLARLHEKPDLVTLDYRLPDMPGSKILKEITERFEDIEVIVISEQEEIEVVVDLLKKGAHDYIVKSMDIQERLFNTINNLRKTKILERKVDKLQKEIERKYDFQTSIVGQSPAIKKVFELIRKATITNITVTVTGETGTGKELVAKAIHYHSKRREGPFVAVNVAAIPPELIESELFGHEKGAFTGAINRRKGKFEEAHGGTLFLDEMGEMETSLQAKLLRVLQEREVTPIGTNKAIKIDCRIIVATHRNLIEEVKSGRFREDLYYRLFGLPIELPPLRERDKDVLLLAKKFIGSFCKENEMEPLELSLEAQRKLMGYHYPGNVRELRSMVELAAVMANGPVIEAADITLGSRDLLSELHSQEMTLREYNYHILQSLLKKFNKDYNKVAEVLDISVSTIYRMQKEIREREEKKASIK